MTMAAGNVGLERRNVQPRISEPPVELGVQLPQSVVPATADADWIAIPHVPLGWLPLSRSYADHETSRFHHRNRRQCG